MAGKAFSSRQPKTAVPAGATVNLVTVTEDRNSRLAASRTADKRTVVGGPPATNGSTTITKKRKSCNDGPASGRLEATSSRAVSKKIKLDTAKEKPCTQSSASDSSLALDKSILSPEVWHYIFTFCPPKSLGNLMAVNKLFNLYLDPASSVRREVPVSTKNGVLGLLKPNAIWQASRRLFWSQMPAPIRPNTELDRWRLVCSPRCQDCGKLDAREQSSPPDPRRPGPGPNGVAIVWAFSRRMCASCLLKKTVKEVDLLLSASLPTAVIPALPFVFLTEDLHVFSATTLQQHQLPRHLQITKRFLSSDVESLEREFLEVKDMGPGTVSEWLKGIAGRGNGIQHDAAKWEKWQSSGGTARMRSQLYPGYRKRTPTSLPADSATNPSSAQMPNPLIPTALRQSFPDGRHERTAEEVAELKAARKAEVERRALSLDPPLTADVLRHIPSFQAAIHIAAPLDDHAWEILKPRLLAQRAGAERVRESEASQQTQGRRHVETTLATTKEARDRVDKDWEEVQAPLRVEISGYADQLINDFRAKNKKVTKGNCARFAIYTLLHVRRLFYARVAVGAAAARAAGQAPQIDPPEGPFTQKLTIENMKWIFDTKIKPRTEPLRKELFYCNDCEGNPKAFGFESVIQHYAAKHTKALSLGNMVVHWRAEWPEHPPFSAEARPAKPPSNLSDPTSSAVDAGQPSRMSCSYQPPETAPAPPLAYPPNAGYGFSVPTYSDYYQQQQQPPPPPVQPYQPQVSPAPFPLQPSYGPTPYPSYQTPAIPYPTPAVEPPQTYVPPQGGQHDYQYGLYQPSVNGPNARPQPSAHADLYQAKLADIARNSREVWRLLGDIKDLPGSARVFVTIHHLVKRFRSRFYETPPLSLFIDGLSDNKDMRPVRNVNGLVCKACHLGLGNAASVEQDRKSFSLPQLSKHFQSKHVEPMQRLQPPSPAAPLDWVVDMVLLPEPAVISRLSSSVNATQRSLVTAALPDAFVAQAGHNAAPVHADQGRRHEPVAAASFFPVSTDDPSKRQTRNGYTAGQGAPNKYPAAAEPAGAGFLADYRRRAESRHSATPATVPDNDRSAHSEVDRHSSQSCRQGGGQNGSQSRKGGKKKRGEKQDRSGPDDRTLGETFRTDDRVIKREDADMCDTHAMKPLETAVSQLRSARPEQVQSVGASQPQAQTELEKNTSRRSHPAPLADGKKEPDIIAGLESHLDQRLPAQPHGQQPLSNAAFYADSRAPIIPQEFQRASEAYSRQDEREDWPSYPGLGSGYQAVGPASRHGGPRGAELEAAYYPRMAPIERQEERHHIQRAQGGFIEALPRRTEEGRFDPAIAWPEEGRGHGAAPREAGYYRHCEGVRMHSRPLVEAYEIVHVIDEHGEYYIRRPVRRQPDSRYGYEERRVHRDARSYAAPERVYTPISRPTLVREAGRAEMGTEGWSAGRRVDAAYYEEYDPRFPAA